MAPRLPLLLVASSLLGALSVNAAVPAFCSGNAVGCIISYTEAQSYCDSNYPATTKTVQTRVHPTATVTAYTTHTRHPNVVEKRAKTTASGWASCSSKLAKNSAFSKACQCIETPVTTSMTITTGKPVTTTVTITKEVGFSSHFPSSSGVPNAPACTQGATVQSGGESFTSYCDETFGAANLDVDFLSGTPSEQQCLSGCAATAVCCGVWYRTTDSLCGYLNTTDSTCGPASVVDQNKGWNSFQLDNFN